MLIKKYSNNNKNNIAIGTEGKEEFAVYISFSDIDSKFFAEVTTKYICY